MAQPVSARRDPLLYSRKNRDDNRAHWQRLRLPLPIGLCEEFSPFVGIVNELLSSRAPGFLAADDVTDY